GLRRRRRHLGQRRLGFGNIRDGFGLALPSLGLGTVQRRPERTRLPHHAGGLRGAFQHGGDVVGGQARLPEALQRLGAGGNIEAREVGLIRRGRRERSRMLDRRLLTPRRVFGILGGRWWQRGAQGVDELPTDGVGEGGRLVHGKNI